MLYQLVPLDPKQPPEINFVRLLYETVAFFVKNCISCFDKFLDFFILNIKFKTHH